MGSYEDPAGLIAGSVVLWVVATSCIALRCASKLRERQEFVTSDWLVMAAWVVGTGLTVLEIYGVAIKSLGYRVGATLLDPTAVDGQLNKAKHIQLAFMLLGIAGIGLVKLSVCFLYWHLFALVTMRRFLIVWIVVIMIWTMSFVLAGLLECGAHLWALFGAPTEYLAHCASAVPSGYAMVGTDIATDFITLAIPIPVVLGMKLSPRQRVLTLTAFLIGALSVGASVAKAYIYIRASLGMIEEDGLLILTGVSIWNLAEVQIGIVAACGPLLWPILVRVFTPVASLISSKLRGSSSSSSASKSNSGPQNYSESHDLPSFVKFPVESELQLAVAVRRSGNATDDGQDGYAVRNSMIGAGGGRVEV